MKRIFLIVLVLAIAGYLYSPFKTTDAYAAALRARDFDTVNRLTDHSSYCDSMKERMRRICREHLGQQMSTITTGRVRGDELKHQMAWWEKGLDSILVPENSQANLTGLGQASVDNFEYTKRGWRSALVFVTVDSNDERAIWTFNLSGWKLAGNESPREVLQTRFEHLYPKVQAAQRARN